ncbi:hypothetical protein HWV62_36179 [Athelia sp. TMB]|nr:hypothetical protein HWV62_36179 [Athelia sp. TMB]
MDANTISLPAPADWHVHLRQGALSSLVTPHVRKGGFHLAYVMPNLKPPITTTAQALAYHAALRAIDPSVTYLMTLYLSPELTPEGVREAHAAGVVGVKSYPRGVTTNSDGGIESYEAYYPVFAAMQDVGLVLNLHGEVPSSAEANTCVLNAENAFLPHLAALHAAFPRLRIVLEHATTRAAVDMVRSLGPTVGCTITAHHLALTVDDWAGQAWHFCKPVAKYPDDRAALREVIKEGASPFSSLLPSSLLPPSPFLHLSLLTHLRPGHPRFFLGSDSAPHPPPTKATSTPQSACAAGVYTSPVLLPLLAHLLEDFGALGRLEGFVSAFGRAFYGRPVGEGMGEGRSVLRRVEGRRVREEYSLGGESVVPFWAGRELRWELVEE